MFVCISQEMKSYLPIRGQRQSATCAIKTGRKTLIPEQMESTFWCYVTETWSVCQPTLWWHCNRTQQAASPCCVLLLIQRVFCCLVERTRMVPKSLGKQHVSLFHSGSSQKSPSLTNFSSLYSLTNFVHSLRGLGKHAAPCDFTKGAISQWRLSSVSRSIANQMLPLCLWGCLAFVPMAEQ